MNKVVAIAQARMGSTRVPGKVMRDLEGIPVLQWTINALNIARGIDKVVLATSTLPADDVIEAYAKEHHINCFRGSESDVLDRFYQCAKIHGADIVIRVTCDCPFLDPSVITEVIRLRAATGADYASNVDPPTYPDGLDVECFTYSALESAWKEATRSIDRDCVTQFISRNRHRFPSANLRCPLPGLEKERWVLDTEVDYEFCTKLASYLNLDATSYLDILEALDAHPELRAINPGKRNERFYEALAEERLSPRKFEQSQRIFKRAIQTIPFGAQTFSKSHLQFPEGRSPLYVSHADGARIFDVDGNDYIDLISALLPVVLGYRDPDVDLAIRRQMDRGISFSLATELEAELSELLCGLIPCAEMVKFGKSGTDVTTAAVRIARACTGRDTVLVGGYHGWADWSMAASDRNLGIPHGVRELSRRIKFGDMDDRHLNAFKSLAAAVIIEPDGDPVYLRSLREFCTENGIVLIFDEVITGFRYHLGGAQTLYGVTPDLACFGKAMANGMPISALVGRKDIMKHMQPPDNIFYSGTFFGETLSIAAAIATIKKLKGEDVIAKIWDTGSLISKFVEEWVDSEKLNDLVKITGKSPRTVIEFANEDLKTFFIQEMAQNGVLIINSNNLSYAHTEPPIIIRIMKAYATTLSDMKDALDSGTLHAQIGERAAITPLRVAR